MGDMFMLSLCKTLTVSCGTGSPEHLRLASWLSDIVSAVIAMQTNRYQRSCHHAFSARMRPVLRGSVQGTAHTTCFQH